MSVSDGQPVNAANTNPAFLKPDVDDFTVSRLGMQRATSPSGYFVQDIQRYINNVAQVIGLSYSGNYTAEADSTGNTYGSSSTIISNGNTFKVAITTIANAFSSSGHAHTGNGADGAQINCSSLLGILTVPHGGLGIGAGTSGGIPYFSSSSTIASSAALAANALILGGGAGATPATLSSLGTTTTVLHGNASGAPSFGAVNLITDVSGTLPLGNGGTNAALTAVSGGVVYSTGSALAILAAGTSGQVLSSNGSSAPSWITPFTNPMTTLGDLIYGGTSGAPNRLAGNSTSAIQVLAQTGTGSASAAPVWTSTTGTGNAVFSASPTFTGTISAAAITLSTVLGVAYGGTGNSSLTAYAVLAGGTTSTGSIQQVGGLGTSGQVLTSNGAGALPTWQNTGGGTPVFSGLTQYAVAYATSTTNVSTVASAGTSGQVMTSNGSAAPTMQSVPGNSTIVKAPTFQAFLNASYYSFTVSVSATAVVAGAVYTNNGSSFTVVYGMTANSTLICYRSAGSNPPTASGTLTLSSGTGPATFTFSAYVANGYYVSPGNSGYNPGTAPLYIVVESVGGGGGGGGGGVSGPVGGSAGSATTFGPTLSASGGYGGQTAAVGAAAPGGSPYIGSISALAVTGGSGGGGDDYNISGFHSGMSGGASYFGGNGAGNGNGVGGNGVANTGGGGAGGGTNASTAGSGGGGGAGAYIRAVIPSPSTSLTAYPIVIGSGGGGGGGGSGAYAGGSGGSGGIWVWEYYQ